MEKTITRAIESRQKNLDKKYGEGVFKIQQTFDELMEKGTVVVGGRQTCSTTDPTWARYMAVMQVINIFNKYSKTHTIEREHVHVPKPGGAFSGGYWHEEKLILKTK